MYVYTYVYVYTYIYVYVYTYTYVVPLAIYTYIYTVPLATTATHMHDVQELLIVNTAEHHQSIWILCLVLRCSVLQCVAACYIVLQRIAECCSDFAKSFL